MADYYYCLSNVGDAHLAAERENKLTEQLNVEQRENRKIAVQRGRNALQKERSENLKKNARPVKRKPTASLVGKKILNDPPQIRAEENDKILSADVKNQLSESDDESIAGIMDPTPGNTSRRSDEQVDKEKEEVRFSQVSDLIEERRKARKLCDQMLESLGTSKPEPFHKSHEAHTKSPQEKTLYAPKSPKQLTKFPVQKSPEAVNKFIPKSPRDKPLYVPKSPKHTTKPPIQKPPPMKPLHAPKSAATKSPTPKSPAAVSGFIPKSNQFSRVDKTPVRNQNVQRSVGGNTRKVNTPNRVVKTKNAVALKFASPQQRREFVPRFIKNPVTPPGILKNKAAAVITATKSPEKVQFYDHFSRRGKEYNALPGMVVRESHPQAINANEAARVQNEMDEIRFHQMQEMR